MVKIGITGYVSQVWCNATKGFTPRWRSSGISHSLCCSLHQHIEHTWKGPSIFARCYWLEHAGIHCENVAAWNHNSKFYNCPLFSFWFSSHLWFWASLVSVEEVPRQAPQEYLKKSLLFKVQQDFLLVACCFASITLPREGAKLSVLWMPSSAVLNMCIELYYCKKTNRGQHLESLTDQHWWSHLHIAFFCHAVFNFYHWCIVMFTHCHILHHTSTGACDWALPWKRSTLLWYSPVSRGCCRLRKVYIHFNINVPGIITYNSCLAHLLAYFQKVQAVQIAGFIALLKCFEAA